MTSREALNRFLNHPQGCEDCLRILGAFNNTNRLCAIGESYWSLYRSYKLIEADQQRPRPVNTYHLPQD